MESVVLFIKENTYIIPAVTFIIGVIFSHFGFKYKDRLATKSHSLEEVKLLLEAVKVDLEIQEKTNHENSYLHQICLVKAFENVFSISMSYEGIKCLLVQSYGSKVMEEFKSFGDVLVFDKNKSVFIKQSPVLVNEKLMMLGFWARSFTPKVQMVILLISYSLLFSLGIFFFGDVLTETQKYPSFFGLLVSIFSGIMITVGAICVLEVLKVHAKYTLIDDYAEYIPYENRYNIKKRKPVRE